MKVLIANDSPFAHFYIRTGIARVFAAMGHECIIWDIHKKPAFDAFSEFEPDILFAQTFNLDRATFKCIKARPFLKVLMKSSDWGVISDSLDRHKYPVLVANKNEIDQMRKLRDETGRPNLLYVHYAQEDVNNTHSHWIEDGFNVVSLMNAADIFDYTKGVAQEKYACDIGFVGGRWGYKSVVFDKWLMPLMNEPKLNIKVFGNQPWGVRQYCGFIPNDEVRHFLASAKVCVSLSEPHSQDFGYDVIERPFKLLSNKCFVISDRVAGMEKLFPTEIVYADNPADFLVKVRAFVKDEAKELRQEKIDAGYKSVMAKHTYFHRVADMLGHLGMDSEKTACMETYYKVVEKLGL